MLILLILLNPSDNSHFKEQKVVMSESQITDLDQVEGEGQVDKIADLGLWPFFSSYACKL